MRHISKCGVVLVLQFAATLALPNIVDEDLTLTYREKLALDKFMDRVRTIVPHRYMREDTYLINWLRAKEFNVNNAVKFLKDNLRWRKENGIDRILEEDFSDLLEEYPMDVETYDKNGAPVMTAVGRDWDIRKAVLFGFHERLHRLVVKNLEEAAVKVREAQLAGKNVTRFHILLNLKSFKLSQHGCLSCMEEIRGYFSAYENHYPGMVGRFVLFNCPPHLQIIRPLVRDVLSGRTRSHLQVFGKSKRLWQRALLEFIDASQLTEDFGGTKVANSQ